MANEKKDLLLLVADEVSSEKTAAAATLAWLAEDVGAEMETYISVDPWGGQNALSRTGHWHLEQFCFVANFYNVLYCAVSDAKALPFKRSAQAMGEILSVVNPAQIADLYVTVFGRYNRPLPDTAVMVSGLQPRDAAEEESMGALWMEPFCFPEILHRRALGLSSEAPDEAWLKLQARGLEKVLAVYCSAEAVERVRRLGLEVEVVDEVHPGDTYGSLIRRVADRWIDKTQMMGYGDQHIALASLGFFLRHKAVVFYQPTEWPQYIKEISPYAKKIGTTVVWGNQAARPMSDDVIAEFGKYDLSMSLGIGVVGMTIREKIKLPPDWLAGARAPWESEYTNEFLEEQIAKGRIPVCYLLYAADLGHLTVFARLFDILCTSNTRCGMGFPSTWYDFEAEALEEMYIPYEQGGVFPRVEPLLSSTGLGVGTEARGFMTKETLLSQIRSALASIREHLGPRLVPIGYYPWEDACPYYQHQTAEPQWDVPVEAGFDYCITYQDEGELPKIVFQKGNLIAINQQNVHWWGGDGPVLKTKEWEKRLIGGRRPGWIMIGLDSPFWCQPPFYYDPKYPTFCKEETSVVELTAAMQYASSGGESGKLFLAKPHEVVRFARLLRARGLI